MALENIEEVRTNLREAVSLAASYEHCDETTIRIQELIEQSLEDLEE